MAIKPVRLINPYLSLATTDFTCFARHIKLAGDEDDELATFCDPFGYSWELELELLMSLGTGSLEAALNTIGPAGKVISFLFAYSAGAGPGAPTGTADNPTWAGSVRLAQWPIVDADVNSPTTFTITMPVIGAIVRTPALP